MPDGALARALLAEVSEEVWFVLMWVVVRFWVEVPATSLAGTLLGRTGGFGARVNGWSAKRGGDGDRR